MSERVLSDTSSARSARRRYQRRKEQGLCVVCGKANPEPGYTMCPECRKKSREIQSLNKAMYIKMGVCPQCRKNTIFPGEKRCPDCTEASSERWKKYTEKVDVKESNRNQNRRRYKERKEKGLCVQCGKRKPIPGKVRCARCAARNKVNSANYRERKMRDEI